MNWAWPCAPTRLATSLHFPPQAPVSISSEAGQRSRTSSSPLHNSVASPPPTRALAVGTSTASLSRTLPTGYSCKHGAARRTGHCARQHAARTVPFAMRPACSPRGFRATPDRPAAWRCGLGGRPSPAAAATALACSSRLSLLPPPCRAAAALHQRTPGWPSTGQPGTTSPRPTVSGACPAGQARAALPCTAAAGRMGRRFVLCCSHLPCSPLLHCCGCSAGHCPNGDCACQAA
jgi:hypothetical protein